MLPPGEQGNRLARFLETIPAIIWSADPETLEFTDVSRAAESILGYPSERWTEPGFWRDHLHPDDTGVVEVYRARVREMRDHELVYRMFAADGRTVWLRDRIHVVVQDDEVIEIRGAMFDITAEQKVHEALVQSEETYRLIVKTSPDAIGVHADGKLLYVNPRFVEIFGAQSDTELLGKDVLTLVHPDYADLVRARHLRLARGESVPMVHERFIRVDGSYVDVDVMAIPVTFKGVAAVQVVARDISDRLQTAERFELLSEGTSEALWEGNLSTDEFWCNAAWEEFVGKFAELSAARAAWAERIHPDDRRRTELRAARIFEKSLLRWSDEYRIQKRDGTWAWVLARGRALEDFTGKPSRIIGSLVDITSLREAEQRYLEIFDEVQDVIYTLDLEGRITALNRSFETRTGYRNDDWIGRSIAELLTPESVPRAFEELSRILQGAETAPAEYKMLTASGSILEIEASGHQRIVDGAVVGSVGIIRDVTERNLLQRKLESSKRISSLGQLAASVAHEFNNVLMSVQPFVEVLLRTCKSSAQADVAGKHIREAISRGKRITNEILVFANPKDPQIEPLDVSEWLASFVASIRETFPSTITVTYVPGTTRWILCDEYQLGQIIMNLAMNARDAMPGGGQLTVELSDGCEAWKLRAGLDSEDYVRITVRDTGCGITEEGLSSLWEPLYTTKRGGTGLGLPIARRLIERQNGVITVDSELGKGTAFHLFMRHASASAEEKVIEGTAPAKTPLQRILLVEDDEAVGEGIEAMLTLDGINCLRVLTGEEVFDVLDEFDPQVIVLDVNLPGISGIEVCARVRRTRPVQPVILSTGHLTGIAAEPRTRALLKPYSYEELIEACHLSMED